MTRVFIGWALAYQVTLSRQTGREREGVGEGERGEKESKKGWDLEGEGRVRGE